MLRSIENSGLYLRDHIRGCLIGGASGDALGYPVEFMSEREIFRKYGSRGITSYRSDRSRKALISDDTQMTLFTANGLLHEAAKGYHDPEHGYEEDEILHAYQSWYITQNSKHTIEEKMAYAKGHNARFWIMNVPDLYHRRAPGNTCLTALRTGHPVEHSKGCGGIMRVAPIPLYDGGMIHPEIPAGRSAQAAALTHGHSLGYIPAYTFSYILACITELNCGMSGIPADSDQIDLKTIVQFAMDKTAENFRDDPHIQELLDLIDLAIKLSENGDDDLSNINRLGKGWVAEETLAISLYCALRHQNDFSSGIIAAVNHGGDSDSTGAVTGNILGALCGYNRIKDQWKQDLELKDVILELADDLCYAREVRKANGHPKPEWMRKYLYGEWSPEMIGQYKSLTSLLPYLTDGSYGEWYGGESKEDGVYYIPTVHYNAAVREFQSALYEFAKLNPEYDLYNYGKVMEEYGLEQDGDADVSRLDGKAVMALLMCAVRTDRFCEGALLQLLEAGSIQRWIARLAELDQEERNLSHRGNQSPFSKIDHEEF